MNIFFPSCNFTKASPMTAKKTRDFFKERMSVAGCCLYDKKTYSDDDIGLILCQACRQQLTPKIHTKTIWEYFDEDESFIFPNYHHQKMYIQDCFRDKEHPEVHQAVRNLCNKMNIDIIEIKNNKEHSTFCGTLHFTEAHPILESNKDTKLSKLPEELQIQVMTDYTKIFEGDYPIIVDCNRCLRGIKMGQKEGIHLLDLIMRDK